MLLSMEELIANLWNVGLAHGYNNLFETCDRAFSYLTSFMET